MSSLLECEKCHAPAGNKVLFGLCAGCLFEEFTTGTGPFSPDNPDPNARTLQQNYRVGDGRFRLMRKLGEGGMGQVWLAEDARLDGKEVALKFIRDAWQGSADLVRELRLELARTRDLQHHHIVKVHDWHDPGDEPPFLSMEYVNGCSLGTLAGESQQDLDYRRLHPLLVQVSEALQYAHEQHGVLHRDIKPGNILVQRSGDREAAKLSDFGVGLCLGKTPALQEIQRGTRAYMSPHQALGNPPRVADDVFSWGATLFHLLTGNLPFGLPGCVTLTPKPRAEDAFGDPHRWRSIPHPVRAMIVRCIDPDPAQRPERMRDVVRILRANPPVEVPPPPANPYALRGKEILDLPSLATRLGRPYRSVDAWIGQRLTSTSRAELDAFLQGLGNEESLRTLLARDLDAIVAADASVREGGFEDVGLRPATWALARREPHGEQLQRLNRFLLEDVFPDELARIGESPPAPLPWYRFLVLAMLVVGLGWAAGVHGPRLGARLRHFLLGPPSELAFRREHFRDPDALYRALVASSRPVDRWLIRELSFDTLEALRRSVEGGSAVPEGSDSRWLLARDLNRLLGPSPIYDSARFENVELRERTRGLVAHTSTREVVGELNRLLLEDAYPAAIRPLNPANSVPVQEDSSLTLGIQSSPGRASVRLSHRDTHFDVVTNVDFTGRSSTLFFDNLRTGVYRLRIVQDGVRFEDVDFSLDKAEKKKLEVYAMQYDATLQVVVRGLDGAHFVLREAGKPESRQTGSIDKMSRIFHLTAGRHELGLGDGSEILHRHDLFLAPESHTVVTQIFSEVDVSFSTITQDGHPVAAKVQWRRGGQDYSEVTPTKIAKLQAGERMVKVRAPGYIPVDETVRIDASPRITNVTLILRPLSRPMPGEGYENGLRMRFAPLPTQPGRVGAAWIGCTETSIDQFVAFANDLQASFLGMRCLTSTGLVHFPSRDFREPGYVVTGAHPATGVSWIDAVRFCEWLTARERSSGALPPNLSYSLMTARDWESACSLREPNLEQANFAGAELEHESDWPEAWRRSALSRRGDDASFTRPVAPSDRSSDPFAVVHLLDNVQEWCADAYQPDLNVRDPDVLAGYPTTLGTWKYSPGEPYRVVCGGSWYDHDPRFWRTTTRHCALETERTSYRGFRVMIVDTADRRAP